MLHAEHNRWWTERLLAGWIPCERPSGKEDGRRMKNLCQHWDMIPFEDLDVFTKDLDRVSIAAMAVLGFGGGNAIPTDARERRP